MQTPNEKRQINHVVTDMINMTVQYFRRIMSTSSAVDKNNVAGDVSDHHPVFKDHFVAATIDIVNGLLSTSFKKENRRRHSSLENNNNNNGGYVHISFFFFERIVIIIIIMG